MVVGDPIPGFSGWGGIPMDKNIYSIGHSDRAWCDRIFRCVLDVGIRCFCISDLRHCYLDVDTIDQLCSDEKVQGDDAANTCMGHQYFWWLHGRFNLFLCDIPNHLQHRVLILGYIMASRLSALIHPPKSVGGTDFPACPA